MGRRSCLYLIGISVQTCSYLSVLLLGKRWRQHALDETRPRYLIAGISSKMNRSSVATFTSIQARHHSCRSQGPYYWMPLVLALAGDTAWLAFLACPGFDRQAGRAGGDPAGIHGPIPAVKVARLLQVRLPGPLRLSNPPATSLPLGHIRITARCAWSG